jgi:hypothetical protein
MTGERTRIGGGGAMVPYDPMQAMAGAARDPRAAADYYRLGQRAGNVAQQAGALFPRAALLGGALIPGVASAATEMEEGRPLGAVAGLAGGAAGAVGAQGLARAALGTAAKAPGVTGAIAKIGMAAAPILGGMFGAQVAPEVAEYAKLKVSKEPTRGKEGELSSQLAAAEQMANLQTQLYGQTLNTNMAAQKDMLDYAMNAGYQEMQRMNPLIQKMKNADLVRQQAMVNTMGQNYAMLGTLATAGKLATGAQAETGATLRTALTSNPYAGSVLQAPSISFG